MLTYTVPNHYTCRLYNVEHRKFDDRHQSILVGKMEYFPMQIQQYFQS